MRTYVSESVSSLFRKRPVIGGRGSVADTLAS